MYTCVYIYIYIHIHTYIHICICIYSCYEVLVNCAHVEIRIEDAEDNLLRVATGSQAIYVNNDSNDNNNTIMIINITIMITNNDTKLIIVLIILIARYPTPNAGPPRDTVLRPVSKDSSLKCFPDPGALNSCMHKFPETNIWFTMV